MEDTPPYIVTNHAKQRCWERWGFTMTDKDGRRIFDDIAAGRAVRLRDEDRSGNGEAWEVTCRAYVMVVVLDRRTECILTVKPRREWKRPRHGKGDVKLGARRKVLSKKTRRQRGISDR